MNRQQKHNNKTKRPRRTQGVRRKTTDPLRIPAATSRPEMLVYLGRGNRAFPPIYRTKLRVDAGYATGAGATVCLTFKANSVMNCGPQVNWAGAFGANVPSDLNYLLSSSSSGGAVAPYSRYRVLSSTCRVRIIQNSSTVANVILFPSIASTLSAMSNTQLREQSRAKWTTLSASTATKPYTLFQKISIPEMHGIRDYRSFEASDYAEGAVSADPPELVYWHISATSFDGSANLNLLYEVQIDYVVEFFYLNNASSGLPTIMSTAGVVSSLSSSSSSSSSCNNFGDRGADQVASLPSIPCVNAQEPPTPTYVNVCACPSCPAKF